MCQPDKHGSNDFRLIRELVASPPGYRVEIFGLSICRLENGSYSVSDEDDSQKEEIFADAGEAAERFIRLRQENLKGFDYENSGAETVSTEGTKERDASR